MRTSGLADALGVAARDCCCCCRRMPSMCAAVRLWAGPDSTRVVLDLSGSARHSLQVLKNPGSRGAGCRGRAARQRGAHAAPAPARCKRVRMARRPSGELRVVLDLARPIQAKSFLAAPNSHYGYRLVIDLGGSSPAVDTPVKVRARAAGCARSHHRRRCRSWRRGSRRHRQERHAREGRGAGHRARARARRSMAEPGMKAVLTRDGDYFVPLRDRMRRARAQQADLFVSIHADSIRDRQHRRFIGVHSVAARRDRRGVALAGRARECLGLDRRGVAGRQGRCARLGAAGPVAIGFPERQPGGGRTRAAATQSGRRGSQAAGAAGALHGAEVPGHPLDAGRDGLYFESAGRAAAALAAHQAKLAAAIHQGVHDYFYANPPAGTRVAQLAAAAAPRPVLATAERHAVCNAAHRARQRGCAKMRGQRGRPCPFSCYPMHSSVKSPPAR